MIRESNAFRQSVERLRGLGYDLSKLERVVRQLAHKQALDAKSRDRLLAGTRKGYRQCHIAPNWLLVYRSTGNELLLAGTGSHTELFG